MAITTTFRHNILITHLLFAMALPYRQRIYNPNDVEFSGLIHAKYPLGACHSNSCLQSRNVWSPRLVVMSLLSALAAFDSSA